LWLALLDVQRRTRYTAELRDHKPHGSVGLKYNRPCDKPGNSNAGQEWGTNLSGQDKKALIE
jgi:hypothetical protein